MAAAVHELSINPGRAMGTIQSAIVSYFEAHQITKFIMYAMSTGNWSTQPSHASGNIVAAAVAVKTGIIQQMTSMNLLSIRRRKRCRNASSAAIPHPACVHPIGSGGPRFPTASAAPAAPPSRGVTPPRLSLRLSVSSRSVHLE